MIEIPEEAVTLIKRWEGFRARWYDDGAGVQTIGYGTTGFDRSINAETIEAPITQEEGEMLLRRSLHEQYGPCVQETVTSETTTLQFAALLSLAYNIGCAAFGDSTLALLHNAGATDEAADEFLRWKYANGEVMEGLLNRRRAERKLYLSNAVACFAVDAQRVPVAGIERLGTPTIEELIERAPLNG